MPTYAYQCPACGHEFQKFHKMSATVRPKCPECGVVAERQITGGAGLLFKGSGFYITDYKKTGEKAGEADTKSKADETGKASKPETAGKVEKSEKAATKKREGKPKGSDH